MPKCLVAFKIFSTYLKKASRRKNWISKLIFIINNKILASYLIKKYRSSLHFFTWFSGTYSISLVKNYLFKWKNYFLTDFKGKKLYNWTLFFFMQIRHIFFYTAPIWAMIICGKRFALQLVQILKIWKSIINFLSSTFSKHGIITMKV